MEKSRLELLREMVRTRPDDTFARYALAMELSNSGDRAEAWQHFDYLLTRHPDYSPAYYQAGKLLAGQGQREEARRVLAKGIEVTARSGEVHAQSELQSALEQLKEEAP